MIRRIILGMFVLILFFSEGSLTDKLIENYYYLQILQSWLPLNLNLSAYRVELQDNQPDLWRPLAWGGATRTISLEKDNPYEGMYSVKMVHTNQEGTVALAQTIPITPNLLLTATVYARGQGGALQMRFKDADSGEWTLQDWQDITASDTWKHYSLSTVSPPGANKAELRLRTNAVNWFDTVTLTIAGDEPEKNWLQNPDFEVDGLNQTPLEWWHITAVNLPSLSVNLPPDSRLSYLNIVDMLKGNYQSIEQRAALLGNDCVFHPDMTDWLLMLGVKQKQKGDFVAAEQIYRLAMDLAPLCPLPYAQLASLYATNNAYLSAANLYHRAADLAAETPNQGRYLFEEGFLHVRYTGNYTRAIEALQQAEKIPGWQGGGWWGGVAAYHLGQAFEQAGHPIEAAAAYQRVLDCGNCTYHQSAARSRLKALKPEQN